MYEPRWTIAHECGQPRRARFLEWMGGRTAATRGDGQWVYCRECGGTARLIKSEDDTIYSLEVGPIRRASTVVRRQTRPKYPPSG